MMKRNAPTTHRAAFCLACIAVAPAIAGKPDPGPLVPVENVDLERYMGKWYEIARYPNGWQKGVVAVVAEYRLRDDGRIDVINTGRKGSLDGDLDVSDAVAWVEDEETNAVWSVRFFWPTKAPYWIIDLGKEYEYAVVGQPSRKNLWILSRAPKLDEEVWEGICRRLQKQGYDPERLVRTPQPDPPDE